MLFYLYFRNCVLLYKKGSINMIKLNDLKLFLFDCSMLLGIILSAKGWYLITTLILLNT
jgi:hypothetical protein